MGIGSALGFVAKLGAKTALFAGQVGCAVVGGVIDQAMKNGVPNKSSKSYDEQKGFWSDCGNTLSEWNKKINL